MKTNFIIRKYQQDDRETLLDLLRLNTPQYFDPTEEPDFSEYLASRKEEYYIIESSGRILGSGGINFFPESGLARISWDMVHPEFHGKGIGKMLVEHRIERIRQHPGMREAVVRTSQYAWRFYEKCGFTLVTVQKDFWAKGIDLYQMKMML